MKRSPPKPEYDVEIKWEPLTRTINYYPDVIIDIPAICDECDLHVGTNGSTYCIIDAMVEISGDYMQSGCYTLNIPGPDCLGPGKYKLKRLNK